MKRANGRTNSRSQRGCILARFGSARVGSVTKVRDASAWFLANRTLPEDLRRDGHRSYCSCLGSQYARA